MFDIFMFIYFFYLFKGTVNNTLCKSELGNGVLMNY